VLWFLVWTLLILGTLVGAFVLGRSVFRSGTALIGEAGRAGERFGALADRVSELEERAAEHPVRPVDLADRQAARNGWDEAGAVRAARRLRRRLRYQLTFARWRSFSR